MFEIHVETYPEGNRWVADTVEIDVSTFGDSVQDARAAIEEAVSLYFEDEPELRWTLCFNDSERAC
jgi:predicted RNase H-like HicB family nuclease